MQDGRKFEPTICFLNIGLYIIYFHSPNLSKMILQVRNNHTVYNRIIIMRYQEQQKDLLRYTAHCLLLY